MYKILVIFTDNGNKFCYYIIDCKTNKIHSSYPDALTAMRAVDALRALHSTYSTPFTS